MGMLGVGVGVGMGREVRSGWIGLQIVGVAVQMQVGWHVHGGKDD